MHEAHSIIDRRLAEKLDRFGKIDIDLSVDRDYIKNWTKLKKTGILCLRFKAKSLSVFSTKYVGKFAGQGLKIVYSVIV